MKTKQTSAPAANAGSEVKATEILAGLPESEAASLSGIHKAGQSHKAAMAVARFQHATAYCGKVLANAKRSYASIGAMNKDGNVKVASVFATGITDKETRLEYNRQRAIIQAWKLVTGDSSVKVPDLL